MTSFYIFRKEKNSDIDVTKRAYSLDTVKPRLKSFPLMGYKAPQGEIRRYSDSLHDNRKIVTLLLKQTLVLPIMILSFVYLTFYRSKTKIKARINLIHYNHPYYKLDN